MRSTMPSGLTAHLNLLQRGRVVARTAAIAPVRSSIVIFAALLPFFIASRLMVVMIEWMAACFARPTNKKRNLHMVQSSLGSMTDFISAAVNSHSSNSINLWVENRDCEPV